MISSCAAWARSPLKDFLTPLLLELNASLHKVGPLVHRAASDALMNLGLCGSQRVLKTYGVSAALQPLGPTESAGLTTRAIVPDAISLLFQDLLVGCLEHLVLLLLLG
jgi:hypothetical protein